MLELQFASGGVHLSRLGLWLDPHEPQRGPVFVSHAHSDHVAAHQRVILSAPTARLMEARLPGTRLEHVLPFGESKRFGDGGSAFEITLRPAGHIFGSAMGFIRAGGETLLYTGDFKLRRGLSAEPCEPCHADTLVMETTFGRPHYVFPPAETVLNGVIRFCREALDNDETAVLLGYSLGKSQELLCSLGNAQLPIMLHGAVYKLTQVYEQFGQCFPRYERYEPGKTAGKVLLCPPHVINSAMLRNLGKKRMAILTGWAVDPNCKYRYQCDAAFPLSDHADFPELLELVKRVQPRTIYTLHGFAAEFAQTLRDLGYDARALSENEQFALALDAAPKISVISPSPPHGTPACPPGTDGFFPSDSPDSAAGKDDSFFRFAETCRLIGSDTRKLEKIRILSTYLRTVPHSALGWATTWFSGRPFPAAENVVMQLGWAVLRDAISSLLEIPEQAFHSAYLKYSDIGEAVAELLGGRAVQANLSMGEAGLFFKQVQAVRGPLAKVPLVKHILGRCTPLEAKYLVKIITGELRIGLKEGLVEEAVAEAFEEPPDEVRRAHLLLGNLAETAELAKSHALGTASLKPFRPIKFMLASPEETAGDVWSRLQERAARRAAPYQTPVPAKPVSEATPALTGWIEDKYDGVRCQLHKVGSRIALYSRDLKEITATFRDVADAAARLRPDVVLDGEILAMNGEEVLPFSELQKRLGRREPDLFMREEVPIVYVAFDLLWLDGTTLLKLPLRERRRCLERLLAGAVGFHLAHFTSACGVQEIESAFEAARARGNEGLMIKDPESQYSPGRRGMAWLKLKKAFATLDCVVVGAEYGHGKRARVLSDYTFAVRDEHTDELRTIGKAYTGLTDQEIGQLTEHFLRRAIRQHGRYFEVAPDTVLEIAFDRLQESDRHTSGLAMRFPRIVRIRTDKSVRQIDTVQHARYLLKRLQERKPARDQIET